MSECVIYKILNKANGKFYIGSTNKVSRRWTHHKSNLKYNRHCNQKLQRAYNKYGKDNFEFSDGPFLYPFFLSSGNLILKTFIILGNL